MGMNVVTFLVVEDTFLSIIFKSLPNFGSFICGRLALLDTGT